MKESTHVYSLLKSNYPEVHWQRIENVAGEGVPDINGCISGKEFWIEAKIAKNKSFVIRNAQTAWLARRHNSGGRCFVLVREDKELRLYKPDGEGGLNLIFRDVMPIDYVKMLGTILGE